MVEEMEYPGGAAPLDTDEMKGLKFPHVTTRGELDHLEQANIQTGLLWLNRRKSSDILNDQFVRNLHKRLFGEVWRWAGSYRLTEKNIGIDPTQINVRLRDLLDMNDAPAGICVVGNGCQDCSSDRSLNNPKASGFASAPTFLTSFPWTTLRTANSTIFPLTVRGISLT